MRGIAGIFVLIAALLVSCGDREAMRRLTDADRVLDRHPDSALSIVRDIDASALRTEEARARHSLLLTLSLLKTDPSSAGDSLFTPAWNYYGPLDTPSRETMLTHYTKACLWSECDSVLKAIEEYENAMSLCYGEDNVLYQGLANYNIGVMLFDADLSERAREYVSNSKAPLIAFGDTLIIIDYYISMGKCLNSLGSPDEAEREEMEALRLAEQIKSESLRNWVTARLAYTLSLQGRHAETVSMYDSLVSAGYEFNKDDLFSYSWSLLNSGDRKRAADIIGLLNDSSNPYRKARYSYLMSELLAAEGEHRSAIEMKDSCDRSLNKVEKTKRASMLESRLDSLWKSMREKAYVKAVRERRKRIASYVLSGIAALVLASVFIMLLRRHSARRREAEILYEKDRENLLAVIDGLEEEMERNSGVIREQAQRIDSLSAQRKELRKARTRLQKEISALNGLPETGGDSVTRLRELQERKASVSSDIAAIEKELEEMRRRMRETFLAYHGRVSGFCNNPPSRASELASFEAEREKLLARYRDRDYIEVLMREIDFFSGGFLTGISESLRLSENLVTTAVYDICGFNYVSIGLLFGIEAGNAAARRTRLKNKLKTLDEDRLSVCAEIMNIMK